MPPIVTSLRFDSQALEAAESYVSVCPRSGIRTVADPDPGRAQRATTAMLVQRRIILADIIAAADES